MGSWTEEGETSVQEAGKACSKVLKQKVTALVEKEKKYQ